MGGHSQFSTSMHMFGKETDEVDSPQKPDPGFDKRAYDLPLAYRSA